MEIQDLYVVLKRYLECCSEDPKKGSEIRKTLLRDNLQFLIENPVDASGAEIEKGLYLIEVF